MSLTPLTKKKATVQKGSRYGNEYCFSTGNDRETIVAWEVWNSRYKRRVAVLSKVFNDETTAVFRTHNKIAEELQPDDSFTFGGYTYSIQEVHYVKTTLSLKSTDYEISVK